MRIRFWGTRGSLPKPGPDTLRFGGNTSCVEVESAAGTLVIIDCGTGIHGLGQSLTARADAPLRGNILISHTHWDHIQGLPFFAPLFDEGNEWDIYAPKGIGQSVQDTLAGQMQYAYFPVRLDQMGATIRYHELIEGEFEVGDLTVKTRYMNHTALTLGFRLEADGAAVVYASDHEPFQRHLASGEGRIEGQDSGHCEFLRNADLVIHDGQFTFEEYRDKIGWGHSTVEYAVAVCQAAGAARLALTHHDPLRKDAELTRIIDDVRSRTAGSKPALEIFGAAEGQELALSGTGLAGRKKTVRDNRSATAPAVVRGSILMSVADAAAAQTIREAAEADDILVLEAGSVNEALTGVQAVKPSLMILERRPGDTDLIERYVEAARHGFADAPLLIVADQEELVPRSDAVPIASLIKPFSASYARTCIRAAMLRRAMRWQRILSTQDEEERLACLHALDILDTPPERRFDEITRLAATSFGAPMALVSLVDKERQWFKSSYGLEVKETSRETSFCSHAVSARDVLIVPDTFYDPRFADNPLVTQGPRIRFYAGCPIFVGAHCVGTVCVLDHRPRQLDDEAIKHLKYLAGLVEEELSKSPGERREG